MRAVDTNILLRLITGDDPTQEQIVRDLMADEKFYVPLTVTMECEWVLRSHYRMSRPDVATALLAMIALDGLVFEQSDAVAWACERLGGGAEFDDLIHIVSAAAAPADAFVTFDRTVPRDAGDATPLPVHIL